MLHLDTKAQWLTCLRPSMKEGRWTSRGYDRESGCSSFAATTYLGVRGCAHPSMSSPARKEGDGTRSVPCAGDTRASKALRSIQQQIQQRELAQFEQHQSLLEQEMLGILRAGARDEATTTDEQPRSTVTMYNARFEQLFAAWRPDQRAPPSVSLGEASACP